MLSVVKRVLGCSSVVKRMNHNTDQVSDHDSDQVAHLLATLKEGALSAGAAMQKLGLSHRTNFRKNYLNPALDAGYIEMTVPDRPKSRLQKYRLTEKGKWHLAGGDGGTKPQETKKKE